MKRTILLTAMSLLVSACGNNSAQNNTTTEEQPEKDHVEILYFHGKQRCATCMAIESNTEEAIKTQFADELENGTVIFKTIDISDPENEKVADKYEVTWSSLIIGKWKDGKETYENLTEFAFANARTSPDTFKSGLTEKVKELLK